MNISVYFQSEILFWRYQLRSSCKGKENDKAMPLTSRGAP
jgi:hypothetical protein